MPLAASLLAADARPHKYSGCAAQSAMDWPIRLEPTVLSSRSTRLPLACNGNSACAPAVTTLGYTKQHSASSTRVITKQGRSSFMAASGEMQEIDDEVDQLD